jgi:hypothetical protein
MFRRAQQQQPPRDRIAVQQQMAGSHDFQAQPHPGRPGAGDTPRQMGEGSYEGTRDYQKRIQRYLDRADVASDAEKARPRSEQDARELEQAEKAGKSHSRGER